MTNEELAVLGATGDIVSIHNLYFAVAPLVYKLISRYFPLCAGRITAPEDLLQCGYFAVLEAIKAFKPHGNARFTSYLGFHVSNACLAELGIKGKRQLQTVSLETPVCHSGDAYISIAETIEDPTANIYQYGELSELRLTVRQEIANLPEPEQYAIYAIYFEGKGLDQLADEMHWTLTEAKKHKYKAHGLLKKSPVIQALRRAWCIVDITEYANPEELVVSFGGNGLNFLWGEEYVR